jgi:hypothetical protein
MAQVRNPPFSSRNAEWYHWHIELAPLFSKKGGLEYGTHCMVLMMLPEVSARNLRETNVEGENGETDENAKAGEKDEKDEKIEQDGARGAKGEAMVAADVSDAQRASPGGARSWVSSALRDLTALGERVGSVSALDQL